STRRARSLISGVGTSGPWMTRCVAMSLLRCDRFRACLAALHGLRRCFGRGESEVDFSRFQVDPRHLHGDGVGQAELRSGALAGERMAHGVEVKVVVAQLRNVDEAIDEEFVQGHEDAEM